MLRLKIGNKVSNFYTLSELASKLERSTVTLRKFEKRGILPRANYRRSKNDWLKEGDRVYSEYLVNKLVLIFKDVRQGVKISDDIKHRLTIAFREEIEYFKNTENG